MKKKTSQQQNAAPLTTAPVSAPAIRFNTHGEQKITPEFIRLPAPRHSCPWTGLSRATLNELVLDCPANKFKAPVKSISLRKPGCVRGCRLILFSSLMRYLHGLEGKAA